MSKPPPLPRKPGRFRQTPPAIFTPIFGHLGLGLAWRRAGELHGAPEAIGEAFLGAGVALFLFATFAYGAKLTRRSGTLAEDLRTLPGRGGLAAAALSVYLVAATLVPYAPGLARVVLFAGLAAHAALATAILRALITAPPEGRAVTPVWHLLFVGFIVAPSAALPLGHVTLSSAIFWSTLVIAVAIWALSALTLARKGMPPPMRPLLAIHAAPAALFATTAAGLGQPGLSLGFALAAAAILLVLGLRIRWVTAAGFSPFWGAFTFPAAALASAVLVQGPAFRLSGGLLLVAASLVVLPILVRILKMWAGGSLAAKTNASSA